ncbi:MAG: gliding motility-associated C-terminal domain-containing protein [Bacteroidetes bacterium]|nr:gliding motility-associated C-terminal domain-containing protein [Bacteroidota bacterium]
MKKVLLIVLSFVVSESLLAQFNPLNPPNDCSEAVSGCSTPSFPISPNVPGTNNVDFGTGTFSNPSINPNNIPGNAGCLLTGETSSTFVTISIVSSGTLSWSIQGSSGGCFDWIMWPYNNTNLTCAQIASSQLAPIACNWNAPCQGFTGMAPAGGLPVGANQGNFERSLNVVSGQQFLLCFSNFSGTNQNVNLQFFGTANVACGVSAPDQTICKGSSANVNIATPGFVNPIFEWLVTNGVSNVLGGLNVTVTPQVTTTYSVKVTQPSSSTNVLVIDTAVFTIFVQNPPVPNAGSDDTLCFGSSIQLQGSISNTANSRSWSYFNVGITPSPSVQFTPNFTTLTPTVNVDQPGLYGFVLRETSAICGARRDTVMVYMKKMTASATHTQPSCTGGADGQVHMSGADATQYSFDNGNTWSTNSSSNGFSSGIYAVCAKDAIGCQVCVAVTVTDPDPVIMSKSNDTTICQNGTAQLLANATGGSAFNYHWGHTTNYLGSQLVSPIQNGYFTVLAENEFGCKSSLDSIYVNLLNPISGTISPFDTICPGYSTMLLATGLEGKGAPYHFSWSDNTVGNGLSHGNLVLPTNTLTYTVTITDNCESTPFVMSSEVFVSPLPQPSFVVDETVKCEPAKFELVNNSDPNSYVNSVWFLTQNMIYKDMPILKTPELSAGNYDVQLMLINKFGCVDSVLYPNFLTAIRKPDAKFLFSPGQPTMFNTKVNFENMSIGAVDYKWTFEEANPGTSNEENPTVYFPDGFTGNYKVELMAKNAFGCVDIAKEIVEVLPEVLLFAPNSFTPDNDQFNQEWFVEIAGIDEYSFDLEINDRWGNIIWKNNDVNGRWDGTMDGQIVPLGMYTWNMKVKDLLTSKKYTFTGMINLIR